LFFQAISWMISYTDITNIANDRSGKLKDLFDLGYVKKLNGAEHPSVALIIDTGVVMDSPDPGKWQISSEKPLFILPCLLQMELEHLKNQNETRDNACVASVQLAALCRDGRIMEGIYKDRIGWFIGAPLPNREALRAEIKQLDLIVKTFGQLATRLIILARELRRTVPGIPSLILTKNSSLNHSLQFMGINSMLFQGFPISGLEKPSAENESGRLDWDEVLGEIQAASDKKLIQVEMSLGSKSTAPVWVNGDEEAGGRNRVLLAQGTGVIHAFTDINFNWTLPYLAWDFPQINSSVDDLDSIRHKDEEMAGGLQPGRPHLDFGSADTTISADIRKMLINKISNCASPMSYIEEMPTVQDPLAVIKQFLIFEYAFAERKNNGDLNPSALEEFENKLKQTENLLNWAYYWLRERKVDQEEVDVSLSDFLQAIRSCWNIGESYRFTLLDNPAEIGQSQEEAGS